MMQFFFLVIIIPKNKRSSVLIKYKNMEDRFEYFFKEDLLRKFYIIH